MHADPRACVLAETRTWSRGPSINSAEISKTAGLDSSTNEILSAELRGAATWQQQQVELRGAATKY